MDHAQQAQAQPRFDTSSVMDVYLATVDAWKKNLDAFAAVSDVQPKQRSEMPTPATAMENTSAQLQKAGENIFSRVIEEQMELCRFFGKTWEQYFSLLGDMSRCHSAADIAQLQLSFLTRMAAGYGIEGRHFAQTFQELVSQAMAANSMPMAGRQLSNH